VVCSREVLVSVELTLDAIRQRLEKIEQDLHSGRYQPGQWDALIRQVRSASADLRCALSEDLSRVSRSLHLRFGRRTFPLANGIAGELFATALGGALLRFAFVARSSTAAVAAVFIWVATFQPLLKVLVGTVLGVRYEYAYLLGVEPRFKMQFGTYVAVCRWKRIALHISGMVGSPLAAALIAMIVRGRLPVAAAVSWAVFWLVAAVNVLMMIAALGGIRRVGPLRTADGSGGAAGLELREALGL
jgi:hypothetical protein